MYAHTYTHIRVCAIHREFISTDHYNSKILTLNNIPLLNKIDTLIR